MGELNNVRVVLVNQKNSGREWHVVLTIGKQEKSIIFYDKATVKGMVHCLLRTTSILIDDHLPDEEVGNE